MIWKPTTKPGVAALILAVLAALSYGAIMVSMAAFGGVETPVVGMFLGVLYILCGMTGGFFAVQAGTAAWFPEHTLTWPFMPIPVGVGLHAAPPLRLALGHCLEAWRTHSGRGDQAAGAPGVARFKTLTGPELRLKDRRQSSCEHNAQRECHAGLYQLPEIVTRGGIPEAARI